MESMALDVPLSNLKKGRMIFLVIYPDAGNAPTWAATHGVASVAFTATGKYTITLKNNFRYKRGILLGYNTAADNVDMYAQGGVVANEGTATPVTLVVKLKTGASNTNAAAADPDNFISVGFIAEDSNAMGST